MHDSIDETGQQDISAPVSPMRTGPPYIEFGSRGFELGTLEISNCVSTDIQQYKCAICLDIISGTPISLSCNHRFCYVCLTGWMEAKINNNCPMCREPISSFVMLKEMKKEIDNLLYKCFNGECKEHIKRSEYYEHLWGCKYRKIRCMFCKDVIYCNSPHYKECPEWVLSCSYCRSLVTRRQMKNGEHYDNCPMVKIRCTYESCPEIIERRDLEYHKTSCNFRRVRCTLDCGSRVIVAELGEHVRRCSNWRNLTCSYCNVVFVNRRLQCSPYLKREDIVRKYSDHLTRCRYFPFTCPYCSKNLVRRYITSHLDVCDEYPMWCNTCNTYVLRKAQQEHSCNAI